MMRGSYRHGLRSGEVADRAGVHARSDSLTNCICQDCPIPFADLAHPTGDRQ